MLNKKIKKIAPVIEEEDIEEVVAAPAKPSSSKKIIKKKVAAPIIEEEEDDIEKFEADDEIESEEEDIDSEEEAEDEDIDSEDEEDEPEDEDEEDSEEDEPEDEEDESDDEEEEEKPAPKKAAKKTAPPAKKKATKKVVEEEEDEDEEDEAEEEETEAEISPAKKFVLDNKDVAFGPAKGRRLFDPKFKESNVVATRSANKEENLNSFVAALEANGLGFIFEGLKFQKEKRQIAAAIQHCHETAVLDCLVNKNTGFAYLNGRIDIVKNEGNYYGVIQGGNMKTPVIKQEHCVIRLSNSEFHKNKGLIYRNENNSSEASVPVKDLPDGTHQALADSIGIKKGDILDDKGVKVGGKKASAPAKKAVKKIKK